MEFNCEGQNGGNNGGIMMYNYSLDHTELCGQFFVLTRCQILNIITNFQTLLSQGYYSIFSRKLPLKSKCIAFINWPRIKLFCKL